MTEDGQVRVLIHTRTRTGKPTAQKGRGVRSGRRAEGGEEGKGGAYVWRVVAASCTGVYPPSRLLTACVTVSLLSRCSRKRRASHADSSIFKTHSDTPYHHTSISQKIERSSNHCHCPLPLSLCVAYLQDRDVPVCLLSLVGVECCLCLCLCGREACPRPPAHSLLLLHRQHDRGAGQAEAGQLHTRGRGEEGRLGEGGLEGRVLGRAGGGGVWCPLTVSCMGVERAAGPNTSSHS